MPAATRSRTDPARPVLATCEGDRCRVASAGRHGRCSCNVSTIVATFCDKFQRRPPLGPQATHVLRPLRRANEHHRSSILPRSSRASYSIIMNLGRDQCDTFIATSHMVAGRPVAGAARGWASDRPPARPDRRLAGAGTPWAVRLRLATLVRPIPAGRHAERAGGGGYPAHRAATAGSIDRVAGRPVRQPAVSTAGGALPLWVANTPNVWRIRLCGDEPDGPTREEDTDRPKRPGRRARQATI